MPFVRVSAMPAVFGYRSRYPALGSICLVPALPPFFRFAVGTTFKLLHRELRAPHASDCRKLHIPKMNRTFPSVRDVKRASPSWKDYCDGAPWVATSGILAEVPEASAG